MPQPPQLFTSLCRLTSHPLAALLSQFALGAVHANAQEPPSQNALLLAGVLHAVAHSPQWLGLVALFTSQPSAALPLQSVYPGLHVYEHVEFAHVCVALGTEPAHEVAQVPQWFNETRRSVSQPLAGSESQLP